MKITKSFVFICTILVFQCGGILSSALKNEGPTRRCGYEGCPKPKPNMINVHLVPHSHDDAGWLKTVDQYYYGSKTPIQRAGVQYILDSVIRVLLRDPNKRFIYVESAFFFKWWAKQTPQLQEQVKMLVNEGRLEFISGGWSMNDEATTHYQSVIDQFTWGVRRLNDTFGECGRPRVGWQIDPFGHSREMASLLAQMGYDGLFFGRLDYEDKAIRMANKRAELLWRGSANLGPSTDLFTGALFNLYFSPPGFCFDILCIDDPIIDDRNSTEYNVQRRLRDFDEYVMKLSRAYRSNNVIVTMGKDFSYQAAHIYYKSLDKLIKHANERQANGSNINLLYSTPSCYLKSLHESNLTWPTKTDDFFPYASDPHSFWTGFYTSRPTLKRFERVGNNFLQVCKQLTALSNAPSRRSEENLTKLREIMGIMQHHDAVTGTQKQPVAEDYAFLLHHAMLLCQENTREVLNEISRNTGNDVESSDRNSNLSFTTCPNLNISSCFTSVNSERFTVTLYNPLARTITQHVRVPVTAGHYDVFDPRVTLVPSQRVPITSDIRALPYRRSQATVEIVFEANQLPPLGYTSFYISRRPTESHEPVAEVDAVEPQEAVEKNDEDLYAKPVTIGNDEFSLTFDKRGILSYVTRNGDQTSLSQNFFYYLARAGLNKNATDRASGAYIFRPNGKARRVARNARIRVVRGDLVDEVHQTFNEWVSQVVRVYKNQNFAEFEWLVGGIPIDDNQGREIITRFTSDIQSNGVFFTDSNAREMIRRQLNHRPTWRLNISESVAGNYFPITSKIAIQDSQWRLAILNDRAQGGSSLTNGSIEIMVHRRLLHDDNFGVREPLNETAYGRGLVARGIHYLVLSPNEASSQPSAHATERFIQINKLLPAWPFFSNVSGLTVEAWANSYRNTYSALTEALPLNVNLLTFEPWKDQSFLIRLEHIFEQNEDRELSRPVTINLNQFLRFARIRELRETTLAANQWLNEAVRLQFRPDSPSSGTKDDSSNAPLFDSQPDESTQQNTDRNDGFSVTLNPMQIRTFVITFGPLS